MKKAMLGVRNNGESLTVFEIDFTKMIEALAEPVVSKKFNV